MKCINATAGDLNNDFILFNQDNKSGKLRVDTKVKVGNIDTHTFLIRRDIIGNNEFILDILLFKNFFYVYPLWIYFFLFPDLFFVSEFIFFDYIFKIREIIIYQYQTHLVAN